MFLTKCSSVFVTKDFEAVTFCESYEVLIDINLGSNSVVFIKGQLEMLWVCFTVTVKPAGF